MLIKKLATAFDISMQSVQVRLAHWVGIILSFDQWSRFPKTLVKSKPKAPTVAALVGSARQGQGGRLAFDGDN
jgi:hypothetical protein